MMRFKEFFKNGQNIIEVSDGFKNSHSWLKILDGNEDFLNKFFLDKYGDKIVDATLIEVSETETTVNIQTRISTFLLINSRRYDRLFINYNIDYEPQNNYDRTEETQDTIDKETYTKTTGATKNTDTLDSTRSVSDNAVVPYDVSDFSDTTKITTTVSGSGADGTIINTSETIEHTDTEVTSGTGKDGTRINKHSSRVYGNIGVTTTVDMLSADNVYWSLLEFYDTLYKDCINECTIALWR